MAKKTKGTPGMGNTAYIEAMRGLRQSSAAAPHRNKKAYRRVDAKRQMMDA